MSEKKAEREGCTGAEQVLLKWSGQGAWLHAHNAVIMIPLIFHLLCVFRGGSSIGPRAPPPPPFAKISTPWTGRAHNLATRSLPAPYSVEYSLRG